MAKRGGGRSRDLTIRLLMDIQPYLDASKKVEARLKQLAKVAATETAKASDAELASIRKVLEARLKAAEDWAKSAKRKATEVLTEEQAAAAASIEAIQKANKAKIAAYLEAGSTEKRSIKEVLTEEEVSTRARSRLIEEMNRKRIKEATEAMRVEGKTWFQNLDLAGRAKDAIIGYAAGYATISTVSAVMKDVAGYWHDLHLQQLMAVDDLINYRAKLLELAALKDSMGDTSGVLKEQLKLRAETLLSQEGAIALSQAAYGAGEIAVDAPGVQRKISEADFQKLIVNAGRMATMQGGDPTTYGEIAGLIPLLAPGRITGDEASAKLAQLYNIQRPGRFKNFAQFGSHLAKMSSQVESGLMADDEMAAVLTAMSIANPGQAATRAQQAIRGVSGGILLARGVKVAEGVDFEATNKYMKGLQLNEGSKGLDRLIAIGNDINRAKAEAAKAGQAFSPDQYLIRHGWGNQGERAAFTDFAGVLETGAWKGIMAAKNRPLGANFIADTFAKTVGTEPALMRQQAETIEALGKAELGSKLDLVQPLRQAAWAQLKREGKMTEKDFATFDQADFFKQWGQNTFFSGYRDQPDLLAQQWVAGEARRVGINPRIPYVNGQESYMGGEALQSLAGQVRAAGGNPMAAGGRELSTAAKNLNQLNRPAPMQGRPPEFIQNRP